MSVLFTNNARSTLAVAISTDVQTTLTVQTGHGDRFPVVASPDVAYVTLENSGGTREIVKITTRTTGADAMTIVRGQEGTTATTWSIGDVVELRPTAGILAMFSTANEALISVAGTDTITGTAPAAVTAYATNQVFRFIASGTNTGATTLNINGIGATNIYKAGATALVAGDIVSGMPVVVVYDGTQFQLVGGVPTTGTGSFVRATSPTFATSVIGSVSMDVFNTVSTTVNAFGAASVALNIGHASAAAAFAGGISIPTGKSVVGAGTASVSGFTTIGSATGMAVGGSTPQAGGLAFPATAVPVADVNTLDDYEENTWTPAWTSLTEVVGGGSIAHSGTYTKIGRVVYWTAKIVQTGGATVASTGGSTRINNLPFTVGISNVLGVTNADVTGTPVGTGYIQNGGTNAYTPSWAATTADVSISGWYTI